MGRSETPTEDGIPILKGKCNNLPLCNKFYRTAKAFKNHKDTCHKFASLPIQVTAIVHELPREPTQVMANVKIPFTKKS